MISQHWCPLCSSNNISGSSFDIDGNEVTQMMDCATCGAEWQDVYRYKGPQGVSRPGMEFLTTAHSDLFRWLEHAAYEMMSGQTFSVTYQNGWFQVSEVTGHEEKPMPSGENPEGDQQANPV